MCIRVSDVVKTTVDYLRLLTLEIVATPTFRIWDRFVITASKLSVQHTIKRTEARITWHATFRNVFVYVRVVPAGSLFKI
jgi:hypothetical protein